MTLGTAGRRWKRSLTVPQRSRSRGAVRRPWLWLKRAVLYPTSCVFSEEVRRIRNSGTNTRAIRWSSFERLSHGAPL